MLEAALALLEPASRTPGGPPFVSGGGVITTMEPSEIPDMSTRRKRGNPNG